MTLRPLLIFLLGALWLLPSACAVAAPPTALPRPDHVVVVIEENHAFARIIDSPDAPYLNDLARRGALLTHAFGVRHPSQPNYIALFAGSTEGVTNNDCPLTLSSPNLRSALAAVGRTFTGYAEDLPAVGATDCVVGAYARKHNPWVSWQSAPAHAVPPSENRPFTDFPTDLTQLPTVSFVVPNQENDMHHGKDPERIQRGDEWLRKHLARYVEWATTHNSVLIVTWDEDDGKSDNHIPLLFVGPMVKPGRYDQRIDHYGVLRTILDLYGAQPIGLSRDAQPLTDIWRLPAAPPSTAPSR